MEEAQTHDVTTIGFTGFDGGRLGQLVDLNIHVKSNIIEHVEDIHLILEHVIVKSIKEQAHTAVNVPTSIAQLPADIFGD
jgi:D-sedoheptulose 7-phosphate isomerase